MNRKKTTTEYFLGIYIRDILVFYRFDEINKIKITVFKRGKNY